MKRFSKHFCVLPLQDGLSYPTYLDLNQACKFRIWGGSFHVLEKGRV